MWVIEREPERLPTSARSALWQLPGEVRRVTLRTDGAGYQEPVLRACNNPALRSESTRFLDRVLSAAAVSVRDREERAHHSAAYGTPITQDTGYDEWREDARQALDGCRRILDDPETYGSHLDRRPGAEDDLNRLSSRIESSLASDNAEIERLRQEKEARMKQEREAQEKEQERQKAKTRDMDMGLEL